MCKGINTGNLVPCMSSKCDLVLCPKHDYANRIIHLLMEMSDDDIMRVQYARKWCREFENSYNKTN